MAELSIRSGSGSGAFGVEEQPAKESKDAVDKVETATRNDLRLGMMTPPGVKLGALATGVKEVGSQRAKWPFLIGREALDLRAT